MNTKFVQATLVRFTRPGDNAPILTPVLLSPLSLISLLSLLFLLFLLSLSTEATAESWPHDIETEQATITIYQPQLESFAGDSLSARSAVSVQMKDGDGPVFGAVWFDGWVLTDRDSRMVTLVGVEVSAAKFPEATAEHLAEFTRIVETEIPNWELTFPLDQLLASLDLVEQEKALAEALNNEPPRIIYVTYPAALVLIDGEPKVSEIENSDLEYVANTPFTIILHKKSKSYYLKGGDWWYAAREVGGPWQVTESVPDEILEMVKKSEEAAAAAQVGAETATAAASETATDEPDTTAIEPLVPPTIIVSYEPAELIQSDGQAEYASIEGTNLLYMKNTDSDVLMNIESQQYYVLLSGRWYTSKVLADGKWKFVPPDQVPAEFQNIPAASEMSVVRASVAGTQEAKEAALDNQIPQTAEIDRKEATVTVEYDGDPQFEKIEDTGMSYAVNTDKSVLLIDGKYYCCDQAVWFMAGAPTGPWTVCVSVPEDVQSIPPSCPVYNVKYVYVYDYTPEVVYIGYTPGYMGSYVYGGCVYYGTGYYYRPWYGHYYYPRPATWGFSVRWNPYTGWSFGFGVRFGGPYGWFGVGVGWRGYRGGWWGPGGYRHGYRHGYHAGRRAGYAAGYRAGQRQPRANNNIYRNRDNGVRRTGEATTRDRVASRDGTGRDRSAGTGGGATRDRPASDGGATTRDRPAGAGEGATRDRSTEGGQGADRGSQRENNVYADRDGNAHRKTDKGWEQHGRDGWSSESGSRSAQDRQQIDRSRQDLNRQDKARQNGNQRSQDYQSSRGSSNRSQGGSRGGASRSRGSGGRGGGGGGRGRR